MVYITLNSAYLMIQGKLSREQTLKACYGTKEWSEKSGICSNCKLKKECGIKSNK